MGKTYLILSRQRGCNQFSGVLLLVHNLAWVLVAVVSLGHLAQWSALPNPGGVIMVCIIFFGDLESVIGSGNLCMRS